MASPVWLIDIVAGQTWRFATRAITHDGNAYADGLETPGSFADALAFAAPAESSTPFSLNAQHVADFDVDDVALGATGTLYFWGDPAGDSLAVTVASGTIEEPEYGGADELITATLREVPWEDRGRIPSRTARINSTTWPNYDTEAGIDDEYYPDIVGEPGVDADDVAGSPAYYVDTVGDNLLVAGHRVVASTVRIVNVTVGVDLGALTVSITSDGLDQTVATVDASGVGPGNLNVGDELWAIWNGGGGLPSAADSSLAMLGAGDLIEYLLHRSTLRVDWGRVRTARDKLNTFRIDTYIQADPGDRVTPWTWITNHLLPLLPIAVRTGPRGLYLAVFDIATPSAHVDATMEAGRNCTRISAVTSAGTGEVVNDLAMEYAPRADTDKGSRSVRVTGSTVVLDAFDDAIRSAVCAESDRRFGTVSDEITTTAIYDQSTATRALLVRAAMDALPAQVVFYAADEGSGLELLEPGSSVLLTDEELGWEDHHAYVWTVTVADVREIELRLWRVMGRDFR